MRTFEVIGHTKESGARIHYRDLTMAEAEECCLALRTSAIYRSVHLNCEKRFTDPRDRAFLVRHYDDPYWLGQGVRSARRYQ